MLKESLEAEKELKKTSENKAEIDNPNTYDELKEANSDDEMLVDQEGLKQQKIVVLSARQMKNYSNTKMLRMEAKRSKCGTSVISVF